MPTSASPSSKDWATLIDEVRSGVVRLQVVGCERTWSGSGFLVGDRFVVTAAHVARGAAAVSVKSDRGIVRAEVLDYKLSADTALLRLQQDLAGHRFPLGDDVPTLGLDIGVLGYPFGVTDLRLSRGTISGGDISVTYEGVDGFTVDHVVTTDAAINGGNSGGPVVDSTGTVVGLVTGNRNWNGDLEDRVPAQGNNLLIPGEVISTAYQKWKSSNQAKESDCGDDTAPPVDPDFDLDVSVQAKDDAAATSPWRFTSTARA